MPGYISVKGNERAEKAAKEAMEGTDIRRCTETIALIAHDRFTISERKWKDDNHWFREENDRDHPIEIVRYDPALESQGQDTEALKKAAYVSRRYFQQKSGHTITGTYLKYIGKAETDRC